MLPDENTQDYSDEVDTLQHVEQCVHPHGPTLLDLYFRVVHPSFPIIQKHLFVERYRNGDRTFSPSLMAGMYILALNWWSYDQRLTHLPKPDAARLEAIAMRSLSRAMERPKLSTVQAGLLLLQRPEADSWSLTTQLVAVGQELGLHLDCSSWSIPLWERGLRKRIAWALYMQDKWSSLIHGRPSHIFSANWAVQSINDDDFNEDGDGFDQQEVSEEQLEENERGQILFAQMIELTQIMAEVMDTFYTQVAIQDFANAGEGSTDLILARAKPVQIKLRQWHDKLPPQVKMNAPTRSNLSSLGTSAAVLRITPLTYNYRLSASRLLCDRNHTAPPHRAIPRCFVTQPIRLLHVSQRREDAPHLRHGLCQSPQATASPSILVFRLEDQLHSHRHVRLVTVGHSASAGGSRFLQDAVAGVPVDIECVEQEGRVLGLRSVDARRESRHVEQSRREAEFSEADQ